MSDIQRTTIVVFDADEEYELAIEGTFTYTDVLDEYFRINKCPARNPYGDKYTYYITTHRDDLYSIRRDVATTESNFMHLMVSAVDIADWWAKAYPIIEQIANVTGAMTGVAAVGAAPFAFVKWFRKKVKSKTKDEIKWIQDLMAHDTWNFFELSETLSISEKQAKQLLKGLGYKWDSKRMLYVATKETTRLREIRPKINSH